MNKFLRLQRGLTLVEILVALSIFGAVLLIGIPNALKNKADAEDRTAIAKARMLNTAKTTYLSANSRLAAQTAWAGYTEEERYTQLKPYLAFPPSTFSDFTPDGYVLTLGADINALTQLVRTVDGVDLTEQTR